MKKRTSKSASTTSKTSLRSGTSAKTVGTANTQPKKMAGDDSRVYGLDRRSGSGHDSRGVPEFPRPFRHCVPKRQAYEQVQAVDEPVISDRVPP